MKSPAPDRRRPPPQWRPRHAHPTANRPEPPPEPPDLSREGPPSSHATSNKPLQRKDPAQSLRAERDLVTIHESDS
ncbi:hypothetical protein GCM10009760_61080 [Kitasatospora kazusensis]|uniref:Uncharacterized protein n=1 Tax=Kitasatospora kazusensis TaxID=407974 RepID=A0ABP5M4R6_9ACTN